MLRTNRISGTIAQKAKRILVNGTASGATARSLSTTRAALGQKAPNEARAEARAFTQKERGVKSARSGTATVVNLEDANPEYYSSPPNPTGLLSLNAKTATYSNTNRFMQLDEGFLRNLGKNVYPGNLASDFKMFGRPALLYRDATNDLVQQLLTKRAEKGSSKASVIDGKAGTGKSAELLKLAAVGTSSDYLVIYAHSTFPWVDSSRPYAPGSDGTMYVQHELTMELMKTIHGMSKAALAKVPLGKEISFGKRSLGSTMTLLDLVDFAVKVPSVSQDALGHLLEIASKQTEVPVLIAVDDVNTLWTNTLYRDQNDAILPASRLRLPSSFRPFFDGEKAVERGWVVGATSYKRSLFMPQELNSKLHPAPKVPVANPVLAQDPALAKDTAEAAEANRLSFDVIALDRMSTAETWALMNFYHKVSVISTPVTDALVAKKWVTASGNPREMFNSVTSYF
ncbi:hypothetical protein GGI11_002966 [Coemansia sp. RSA 2049]|nr:hypothetical protein GGI11_002966 [Coemansia sp. RSA 2049]